MSNKASNKASNKQAVNLPLRLQRLRKTSAHRQLVREHRLSIEQLIQPLFVKPGQGIQQPIASMPGQFQCSVDTLVEKAQALYNKGIAAVLLFGIPEYKDAQGSAAWQEDGIVQQAIRAIKAQVPEMLVIADVCFCEYTDHGHCGVLCGQTIDNDATLVLLAEQAVSLAHAGADMLAPSGMMDGMVAALRQGLDEAGFQDRAIMSYSSKYCSSLYGPFREAAEGAPQFGDRQSYQMDMANGQEALRESQLDVAEGADILMVKPAAMYLDVIYRIKQAFPEVPLACYHVSGEYAMIKAAVEKGWLDEQRAVLEATTAMVRAGANMIITYYAEDLAQWLR